MLRRAVAAFLLILIALPFTAPFPSCDLTHHSNTSRSSFDDGSHALPLLNASTRTRTRFVSDFDTNTTGGNRMLPAPFVAHGASRSSASLAHPSLTALRV